MVAALLRALGFDDEAEAPAGEGQDRAPVGAGEDVPEDVTQARQRSVRAAADQWIGTPYGMGGSDQKAIDCSGLVNALLRGFGAPIPPGHGPATTGWRNGQMATPIPWESIQPGDVLLSPANPRDPQNGEHMALYVGGGQMVEAAGPAGAPVRYSPVTNRNLQPYRMREAVPGLQQVTLMAQHEAGPQQAQGAAQSQPAPSAAAPPSIQRIAMNAGADPDLAEIMAAGAKTENPSLNPQAHNTQGEDSVGLWQANRAGGAGRGYSVAQLQDPQTNARAVIGDYRQAYQQGQQQGLQGDDLAVYTYLHAERPRDQRWNGVPASGMRQNYAEVTAQSAQMRELQIGGGYAPPSGAPGQQNAGGVPARLQQAWDQAQPVIEQLRAQLGGAATAVGNQVASLGATPAYAAETAPPAGPPPGPTPQVQQPPPPGGPEMRANPPADQSQSPGATPGGLIDRPEIQAAGQMLQPGVQAAGGVASALGTAAQNTIGFGNQLAGVNTQPQAPAPAAVPAGPTPPPQPPVQEPMPGGMGTNAPGPDAGTYGPPQPAQTGAPPDTATEHWDARIRAWVPIRPPSDFGQAGGHYRVVLGQEATDPNTGAPQDNPPGTPVEYLPNSAGNYPQGYWDGVNWHPSNAASQQQVTPLELAPGLRFTPSTPHTTSGIATWTDPDTGAVSEAPYTLGDPIPEGLGKPSGGLTGAQQASQQHAADTLQVERERLIESVRTANLADQRERERIANEMERFNRQLTSEEGRADRPYRDLTAEQRLEASLPVERAHHLYTPTTNPDTGERSFEDAGPVPQTPLEEAQTQREQLGNTAPISVGNRVYRPTRNADTGELSFGEGEPVPMSAEQQALADERAREHDTLSAYQQSQAEQSKASLEEQKSEFGQSLAEKQAESARPYQQMTKAEQAQDARAQQELGLKKEQLGFQETESANKLEPLPRGGLTRVNPYTGQIEMVNAPEPEDIRMVGSQIYIPGGRQVSMLGQQISGGPNPYAGVPSGQGAPFRYPGGSGGGGQSFGAGGWGGGGMTGGQGGGGYGWQQPQQPRQGWMGGY